MDWSGLIHLPYNFSCFCAAHGKRQVYERPPQSNIQERRPKNFGGKLFSTICCRREIKSLRTNQGIGNRKKSPILPGTRIERVYDAPRLRKSKGDVSAFTTFQDMNVGVNIMTFLNIYSEMWNVSVLPFNFPYRIFRFFVWLCHALPHYFICVILNKK